MQNEFELVKLGELFTQIENKPLGEARDIAITLAQGKLVPPKLQAGKFSLSFAVGAGASVQSFNSRDDKDPNGVVGVPDKNASADVLKPQLLLGNRAWLKYQVTANVEAGAGVKLPILSADAKGETNILLSDYRSHALSENAWVAIRNDLGNRPPRTAFDMADVLALGVNDAVAFQMRCKLGTSVSLNWADVFTANLGLLAGLMSSGEVLGIQMDLAATLSAGVTLTDDFLVVFSRPAPGHLRVAVHKATSRAATGTGALGIEVGVLDPDAFEGVLTNVVTSLAGQPIAVIDEFVNKASFTDLSNEQRELLRGVFTRLGLNATWADLVSIRQSWNGFKEKVQNTLEEIAKAKVKLGFQYEYMRVRENSSLLEVELSESETARFHPDLIRGDIQPILDWLRQEKRNPDVYLHQRKLTTDRTWGFTLDIGKWARMQGKDRKKLVSVEQTNFDKARRLAVLGLRSYGAKAFGDDWGWLVDFKAETEKFLMNPTSDDFQFGLHLLLRNKGGSLSKKGLRRGLDNAIVWRLLEESDEEAVMEKLSGFIGEDDVETVLELKLDDTLFRALLTRVPDMTPHAFAQALARSMPWENRLGRSDAEVRRALYTPIWKDYFQIVTSNGNKDLSPQRAAERAAAAVRHSNIKNEMLAIEQKVSDGGVTSFGELIHKNPGVVTKWSSFVSGMNRLRTVVSERRVIGDIDTSDIARSFEELEELWQQDFHVKALGALITDLAMSMPGGLARVERTLTLRTEDKQVVVTSSKGKVMDV